jgi:predicted Mrr-cat superfamily restriction endonuclease
MSIDKMPVFKKFPAKKEQSRLVMWIENKIYKIISRRINWILDRVLSGGIEIIVEGNEPGDDGNWRIIIISGDLKFQKRVSSAWADAHTISGS